MGTSLISLRGAGGWRGKTTKAGNDRGDRRFLKMENCYVSGDGHEIRHFPGWRTLLDLSADNNPTGGYDRYIIDAVRPVLSTTPNDPYPFNYNGADSQLQTLRARAKVNYFHCFEQVRDVMLIVGETRFRENLIMSSAHIALTMASVSVDATDQFVVNMSGNVGTYSASDSGASLNGLVAGNTVYLENVEVESATMQAAIDARLNGRLTLVVSISLSAVTLRTQAGLGLSASSSIVSGDIHVVRPNRSDDYPTPAGPEVYGDDLYARPDDPDALTSFRVVDDLTVGDPIRTCYPAWVANRQRDFDDSNDADPQEGIAVGDATSRGVSRREQLKLPYRVNPEPAFDRLILAAPGYNCLFHIPVIIPVNPNNWPDAQNNGDLGILWFGNDIYDKPRALGIPKPRMIECAATPAPSSPGEVADGAHNFSIVLSTGSPQYGLAPGTYRFCISFEDEATGEEGLASEPIEVEIPDNDQTYTIAIHYMHPGYVMPECLAFRMNVYIAPPGFDEVMGYYTSYALEMTSSTVASRRTGKYGFESGFTPNAVTEFALRRRIELTLPNSTVSLEDAIDFTRLAPLSAAMPRGAESARYVRGVVVAVGHRGTWGNTGGLWGSYMSARYETSGTYDHPDELLIRAYDNKLSMSSPSLSEFDGVLGDQGFGIAGRHFPDAYQGISGFSLDLIPGPRQFFTIDRVRNHRTLEFTPVQARAAHYERIGLTRKIFADRRAAGSPSAPNIFEDRNAKRVFYVMPSGQVQVGDPGAPSRASKAAIQFLDPSKDDDGVAVGNLAGSAIICSRKETWSLAWNRDPGGEIPRLVSNQHGCIGANTMVEFDGGLAWISERGPVAMGMPDMHVGSDIEEDFTGSRRRYLTDSRGMMRHAWGAHDAARGLVYWGLLTTESSQELEFEGESFTFDEADDQLKSRFPCDEVLVWSYRSGAFTTWRPPLGVYWTRPTRTSDGIYMGFQATDGRIYALDDYFADTNTAPIEVSPAEPAEDSTTIEGATFTRDTVAFNGHLGRGASDNLVRDGMLIEVFDPDGNLTGSSTVSTADYAAQVITASSALSWGYGSDGWSIRIGARPTMTLESTSIGAEVMNDMSVTRIQVRHHLYGTGACHARLDTSKTDRETLSTPTIVEHLASDSWQRLGDVDDANVRTGRRLQVEMGENQASEMALQMQVSGASQIRITDIMLEVEAG